MNDVREWLEEKLSHRWGGVREPRTVNRERKRALGGHNEYAALTVSVSPASRFELVVNAENVPERFVAAAKNAVFTVLLSQGHAPILALRVELSGFVAHEDEATYVGFYEVAKDAMEQALGTRNPSELNISFTA